MWSSYLKRNMKAILIICLCVTPLVMSFECTSSGNITCECNDDYVTCTGVQTNISEIQEVVYNISDIYFNKSLQSFILTIKNLQFESDFKFENLSVKNLSLGYDLQNLHSGLLNRLGASLISLNLANNSLQEIKNETFSLFSSLVELHLDFNMLLEVSPNLFYKLNGLEYLSITGNQISELDPEIFVYLPAIHTLILDYNNITTISKINVESSSLLKLQAKHCSIHGSLEPDSLSQMRELKHVDLSNNLITKIKSYAFSKLKNLEFLNLSYNAIDFIPSDAFSELFSLTHLDLKYNKILRVDVKAFANLENLKILDLSGNLLEGMLCEYTSDLPSLERIDLQNNNIKLLTTGTFSYSPNLMELNLQGNNLKCSCELSSVANYLVKASHFNLDGLRSVYCESPNRPELIRVIDFNPLNCYPEDPCLNTTLRDMEYEDATVSESTTFDGTPEASTLETDSNSSAAGLLEDETTESYSTTFNSSVSGVLEDTTESFPTFSNISTVSAHKNITESDSIEFSASTLSVHQQDTTELNSTVFSSTISVINEYTTESSSIILETSDVTAFEESTENNITMANYSTPDKDDERSSKTLFDTTTESQTNSFTDITTVPILNFVTDRTSDIYITDETTVPSDSKPFTTTSITTFTTPLSSEITDSSSVIYSSTQHKTSITTSTPKNIPPISSCPPLDFHPVNVSSNSEFNVIANFTYTGSMFCLKYAIIGNVTQKTRCYINYSFIGGKKGEYFRCSQSLKDIIEWSTTKRIYSFCIFVNKIKTFCKNFRVSATNTSIKNLETTSPLSHSSSSIYHGSILTTVYPTLSSETETSSYVSVVTSPSNESTKQTNYSTAFYSVTHQVSDETTTIYPTIPSGAETSRFDSSTLSSQSTNQIVFYSSSVSQKSTKSYISKGSRAFNITAFDVHFNNSRSAVIIWNVNNYAPSEICNITITVFTLLDNKKDNQVQNVHENVFDCKNNSFGSVTKHDILEVCLNSRHILYESLLLCVNSPVIAYQAAISKKEGSFNQSSSLIPLICLLIIVLLVIIIIMFRNRCRKRLDSNKYDVHAEEKKVQQRTNSSSSRTEESVRYSYIARQQQDV